MSSTHRRHRRTACTGMALVLPLAALAACGGGSGADVSAEAGSGKGTISVWAHQGQKSQPEENDDPASSERQAGESVEVGGHGNSRRLRWAEGTELACCGAQPLEQLAFRTG